MAAVTTQVGSLLIGKRGCLQGGPGLNKRNLGTTGEDS